MRLNSALAHTASEAAVIAVIDSDYVVQRRWLRDLTPLFAQASMSIVQAPQDYRDARHQRLQGHVPLRRSTGASSTIGMITRNERPAPIIQHGTADPDPARDPRGR